MIFVRSVVTTKSTVASKPLITPWSIAIGLIYKLEIMFPPGPSGLVGVAIHNASHRIYPADSDQWFIGDNVTISFEDEQPFDEETKQVEIHTYNLDDYYSHEIQIRLGIITDTELIKSRYGYANIDALITQLQALNALLIMQNTASGKYSTKAATKL